MSQDTAPQNLMADTTRLKPYPDYKDSGVPWLGEVPGHWEVRRLKTVVTNVNEQTSRMRGNDVYIALEHVESWTGRVRVLRDEVAFDSQVKRFEPDDVLLGKLRPYLAKVTRLPVGGVCVGEFLVLRARNGSLLPPFLEQELRSHHIIDVISSSTFGAKMPRANWDYVGSLLMTFPPIPEQATIVRFLDHVDRRIRRYIHTKHRLIKLLEEQKQVIIHHAVTRGLDPNVRLKSSGVEWLGEVPEHWEVVPLKFLSRRVQNGATPQTSEPAFYENGTVPWYGPSSCGQHEQVGTPVRHLAEAAFRTGCGRLIHGPALLIVVIGATAGRMALLSQDGSTNQQITSYELRTERVNPRFALRQIRGAERWLRAMASTATIPILDAGEVSRIPVAVPPLPEQEEIVRHAEENTTDLSAARPRPP